MKSILLMNYHHHHTKLVQPNYNCEACNLCFLASKGCRDLRSLCPRAATAYWEQAYEQRSVLATSRVCRNKGKKKTAVRAAKSPCDQTPLMIIQPNFGRWITPSSHPSLISIYYVCDSFLQQLIWREGLMWSPSDKRCFRFCSPLPFKPLSLPYKRKGFWTRAQKPIFWFVGLVYIASKGVLVHQVISLDFEWIYLL